LTVFAGQDARCPGRAIIGAAFLERYLAPARATFARDAWDAELAVGAALSRQEAVALLLSPSSEVAPRPRPAARDAV
jgi:hypothetical protein